MISIIQRVSSASILVNNEIIAKINQGILALVCVEKEDDSKVFNKITDKILKYRIFEDAADKMNLSLQDICGGIILVPQFTLAANTTKGNRPSFSDGCPAAIAKDKFENLLQIFRDKYPNTQSGIFGADMKVSLINDGPVTFSFKV
ncbi:D-tyrosyl-tRNA(Tyr) deacylase [Allofrancisella guangzhouensis]|uniref:D-aminoacyl-tRNA deacylase n=1 Tax=Allofrancisella guangzhouensis TaxID=594679 RepID=A0A0A8E328_9GAMM|nr:D-aminoacyl-tRNA deacylase [Allofrancisella guangzhouensis]AJC48379.1 D-tyrosyl-tRNA(Tyr) deacylase [Allofrancisella guangzhouensis]MBK2026674.1 D-tyrosyl-tRNA(Tyr) deacylase [Allofrancisella guangzhouensis]MBK2043836.1 D-tyrosyl-tRNA(Tyr) deacylase [Allofrancisella guangzhouensis]MBK2045511.1 D-tyrosyl-tRNA(Tyr) deacylase [Allofrancisella guangzhouensis]